MRCHTSITNMTFNAVEYFKCTRCGEVNTVSELTRVEEKEKMWSMRSSTTAKRKFDEFAARHGLKAGDALSYLLTLDRKSTRLNSSHLVISYAVFCLKKKKKKYKVNNIKTALR